MKKIISALALCLGISSIAKADFLLEPYLGYELGTIESLVVASPSDVEMSAKPKLGVAGVRFAYKPNWLWMGVDGAYGIGEYNPDPSKDPAVTVYNNSVARKTGYGVIGIDFPMLLRVWAGYGFYDSYKDTSINKEFRGHAVKAGIGLHFAHISLNGEYLQDTYSLYDAKDIKKAYSKYDSKSIIVSLSIPFTF